MNPSPRHSPFPVFHFNPGLIGPVLSGLGLVLGLIQLTMLWGTEIPLGVPKEWTWARSGTGLVDLWNLWPALLMGVLLFLFVQKVGKRCEQASSRRVGCWLLVLWLGGILWSLSVVASIPGVAGLGRVPFVLFYTRSSGYFTQARDEARPLDRFLSTYRERIADSRVPENYLHLGTHPPGLTTAFVGIMRLCEASPGLCNLLLATRPNSVREGFEVISTLTAGDTHPLRPSDAAAIWLAALLVIAAAAGTSVPLYLLARRTVSRTAAWWGAAFWLLVPAVMVFFPKSDVLFPCAAMWIQWLWLKGVDRHSFRWGAAAGVLIFLATCLTLAFAPIGLMLFLQGLLVMPRQSAPGHAPTGTALLNRARVYGGGATAFGASLLAARLLGGINLLDVWLQNLTNHAAFYQHATRSYLLWLLENPIELGFSLGLPLACLSGLGAVLLLGDFCRNETTASLPARLIRFRGHLDLLIPMGVWGILWLSGKNMGEAARLWVFLMPYGVWLATPAIQRLWENHAQRHWLTGMFLIQMGVCLGTVLQIDGFQFAELMAP